MNLKFIYPKDIKKKHPRLIVLDKDDVFYNESDIDLEEGITFMNLIILKGGYVCCRKLRAVKNRRSYQCPRCSEQFYPLAGTIMEKTTTEIWVWTLFISELLINPQTRICDILNGFELTNISYKTAHRIYHLIKNNIIDGTVILNSRK